MSVCLLALIFTIPANILEALCVEWCKARARALRWTEEVQLLLEEMRRVLQFLEWKSRFWEMCAEFLQDSSAAAESTTIDLVGSSVLLHHRIEGVRAYGLRQAQISRDLHDKFKALWCGVPALVISQGGREADVVFTLDAQITRELTTAAFFLQP